MNAHKFGYNKQKGKASTVCNSDVAKLIQTSELHTSEMVKMKEQLFRKFKESEKMQEANKMILENGFKTEDGKIDFMITLQEENDKLSQIIKEDKKISHMITLNDTLEKTFDPPLECKNCEIALLEFVSPNTLINIDDTNNIFEYQYFVNTSGHPIHHGDWNTLVIEPGCYSIKSLQNNLNDNMPQHLDIEYGDIFHVYIELKNNKAILRVIHNLKVRFTHPNSFGKVLGFSGEYVGGDDDYKVYESDKEIAFVSSGLLNVHLNCLQNSFENQQESNLVYSFNNQQGDETNPKKIVTRVEGFC